MVRIHNAGVSDAAMSPEVRKTLIERSHIDSDLTSLLPHERAQGKEVEFQKKKKPPISNPAKTADKKNGLPSQENGLPDFQNRGRITYPGLPNTKTINQNSFATPSNVVTTLAVVALATGYFLRRRMFGVKNPANKNTKKFVKAIQQKTQKKGCFVNKPLINPEIHNHSTKISYFTNSCILLKLNGIDIFLKLYLPIRLM